MDPIDSLLGTSVGDDDVGDILPLDPSELADIGPEDPLPIPHVTLAAPSGMADEHLNDLISAERECVDAPRDPESMLRVSLSLLHEKQAVIQELKEQNSKLKARVGDTRMLLKQFAQRKVDLDRARKELEGEKRKNEILEEKLRTRSPFSYERDTTTASLTTDGEGENVALGVLRRTNEELFSKCDAGRRRCEALQQELDAVRALTRCQEVSRGQSGNHLEITEEGQRISTDRAPLPEKRERPAAHVEDLKKSASTSNSWIRAEKNGPLESVYAKSSMDLVCCPLSNEASAQDRAHRIGVLVLALRAAAQSLSRDMVSRIANLVEDTQRQDTAQDSESTIFVAFVRSLSYHVLSSPSDYNVDAFCHVVLVCGNYEPLKVLLVDIIQLYRQSKPDLCSALIFRALKHCPTLADDLKQCQDDDPLGAVISEYIRNIMDCNNKLYPVKTGSRRYNEVKIKALLVRPCGRDGESQFQGRKALRLRCCEVISESVYAKVLKEYLWPMLMETVDSAAAFNGVVLAIGEVLAVLGESNKKIVRLGVHEVQVKLAQLLTVAELTCESRCCVAEALANSLMAFSAESFDGQAKVIVRSLDSWRGSALGTKDRSAFPSQLNAFLNCLQGLSL